MSRLNVVIGFPGVASFAFPRPTPCGYFLLKTVQFLNDGTKPHELVLATFEPGKGVRDVDGWIEGGYEGEPPVTFLGGMQTIPSGESVFLTIDIESGVEYTALDFQTNSTVTFTVT